MFDCSIYRLFVLNRGWKRDSLQMMIFVNVCSTWIMVQLKTCFEAWITRNDVNGESLFNLPYLITLMVKPMLTMDTKCPNQVCFRYDLSIYRLFVLNRSWKRNSLQIMIFLYVCSTWGIVELKTRLETWITTNHVNGVCLTFLI
jgi:hypothetical protein